VRSLVCVCGRGGGLVVSAREGVVVVATLPDQRIMSCATRVTQGHYPPLSPMRQVDGHFGRAYCMDTGAPEWGTCGGDVQCGGGTWAPGAASSLSGAASAAVGTDASAPVWVLVDIESAGPTSVKIDLTRLNGAK
jgi:hypothetical protein